MGRNIASCGHELPKGKTPDAVAVKAVDNTGKPAISYKVLCQTCLHNARIKHLVLETNQQIEAWLKEGKGEVW